MTYKVHSQGAVPFSWENRPGVSKVVYDDSPAEVGQFWEKLPPPPCPLEIARASFHELPVPLPPSGFQLSRNCSSRRQDDPFLNAYRKCTKGTRKAEVHGGGFGLRKKMKFLSCKNSVSVRYDTIIRIPEVLKTKSERQREL